MNEFSNAISNANSYLELTISGPLHRDYGHAESELFQSIQ